MPGPNKKSASVDRMYLIDGADWNPEGEVMSPMLWGMSCRLLITRNTRMNGKKHFNF